MCSPQTLPPHVPSWSKYSTPPPGKNKPPNKHPPYSPQPPHSTNTTTAHSLSSVQTNAYHYPTTPHTRFSSPPASSTPAFSTPLSQKNSHQRATSSSPSTTPTTQLSSSSPTALSYHPYSSTSPTRVILAACTGDVNFTLTTLLGRDFLPQIPGLGNHIKRGGIAMYGHSLGGATPADG